MGRFYRFNMLNLAMCASVAITMGFVAGNSRAATVQKTKVSSPQVKRPIDPKSKDVLKRMRDHYAGLESAELTLKTIKIAIGDGKTLENQPLEPEKVYFQSPDIYKSGDEEPQKLPKLTKAQVEEYGRSLENNERYYTVVPQLFQGFGITDMFPVISYKGQKSINGEKTEVVVLKRDLGISDNLGMAAWSILTLWVNGNGQLLRFELAATSKTNLPNFEYKNLSNSYRTDITEIGNTPLPVPMQITEQPKQIDKEKEAEAREVLQRMRTHYAGLKTAVLTAKMSRSMSGYKVQENREFGAYHAYFQAPDIFGSDIEETHKLIPLSKSQVKEYGDALIDPAFGYLIIIPQLFQGFGIADTFPGITSKGQETLDGETLDTIVLERDLSDITGSAKNILTLWVNGAGELKRYDLTFRSSSRTSGNIDYSFSVGITEVDNGQLPQSFFKKPQTSGNVSKPKTK